MDYLIALHTGDGMRTLTLHKGERAKFGEGEDCTLHVSERELGTKRIGLRSIGDGVHILDAEGNRILSAGDVVKLAGQGTLAVLEKRSDINGELSLAALTRIRVGRSSKNDICLKEPQVSSSHAVLQKQDGHWFIRDNESTNGTFVDGRRLGKDAAVLQDGIQVFIGGFIFMLRGDNLRFENTPGDVIFSPELAASFKPENKTPRPYPAFYRSPRLRASGENAEVEVLAPPSGGTKPTISWLSVLLPPGMMAVVMLSMAVFMRNTTTIFYTLPMSMVSVLMAVINYRSQTKKWRQTQELVKKKYEEHLAEKEEEITAVETSYLSILSSINPGVRECLSIARDVGRRLWERTPRDADFLTVRLGRGQTASNVEVKVPKEQLTLEENPYLKEAAKLKERHMILNGIPICHSFLEAPITGLVGSRQEVQKTAWEIVMDIATHHSYEDVKIICVYPESEKDKWEWVRWLPHVWNPARTRRSICCTAESARPGLREIAEMLKVRRRESSDSRDEGIPTTPFYFLLLADKALVECSGEQLLPGSASLGFATLYAYGDIGSLPGECQAIIECGDADKRKQGTIRRTDTGGQSVFMPDRIQLGWMDDFARALAPVRLRSTGGSGIPSKVSFLQGLGVKRVEELNLMQGWESRRTYESLAAPIGIRENGDRFNFDIHEKYMGVHGAIAGTSGSGKSEMLTAWLLSMAVHFSPVDVNFLLIEFKGNDLSNILKTLPHMAGVVSNLQDASIIERSLRSLDGEKDRRARIFESISELSSKNISEYQKYQKSHPERTDLEPLPYLITVLDEFAEFKSQFPDQMDLFNSITRVGRSYGIYMVLSTQSPGGIITPQMESNIRFRICLRTANTGESKEIIGTTDAFFISNPGRAYVKVGDSIYEQVQTFYSKVPYNPKAGEKAAVTDIEIVELDGKRVRPQSHDKTVRASSDTLTEGQMVVRSIVETAKQNQLPKARPVWTEPLPPHPDKNNPKKLHYLYLSELAFNRAFQDNAWQDRNSGLAVTVGLVDNPEAQRQYPFVLDFMGEGHQILYGAPSAGKTTFLQTAILSAALSYTPDQVQFLVLDFGNWGMKIFEGLPHMLMVGDAGDKEKMKKAEEYLLTTLDSRKRLYASQGVGTLSAYREVSGKGIPALIIAVDNMAALYSQYPDTMDTLIQIAREGGGLGVYLLLTAGNPGSFMFRIAQYVKANHALQLTDRSDYRQLVGGTGRQEPGHYSGRGFTKGPLEFQTALCVEGASEGERVKQLRAICTTMSEAWKGKRASLEEAEAQVIDVSELSFDRDGAQIGVDKASGPVEFVFSEMHGCIISGMSNETNNNVLGLIVRAIGQNEGTKIYLYEAKPFLVSLCADSKAAHDGPSSDAIVSELADEFDSRDNENEDYVDRRIIFCIDDFLSFYRGISQESADILDAVIRSGAERGIYVYIAASKENLAFMNTFKVSMKPFDTCLKKGNAIVAGGNLKDYTAFNDLHNQDDMTFSENEGCVIHDGKVTPLKFAKLEAKRDG